MVMKSSLMRSAAVAKLDQIAGQHAWPKSISKRASSHQCCSLQRVTTPTICIRVGS
jgi:hypothetical protein